MASLLSASVHLRLLTSDLKTEIINAFRRTMVFEVSNCSTNKSVNMIDVYYKLGLSRTYKSIQANNLQRPIRKTDLIFLRKVPPWRIPHFYYELQNSWQLLLIINHDSGSDYLNRVEKKFTMTLNTY